MSNAGYRLPAATAFFLQSRFASRAAILCCIAAVAAAVYAQSFGHQFVIDDHHLLKTVIAGMQSPLDAWKTTGALKSYYRPLFFTSLYIDYRLFGQTPFGYHLVNLLLHCAAVLCAFLLAERLLRSTGAAALAALLFALHPSHTENVSWVCGRTDLLAAIFVFLALSAFYDLLAGKKQYAGLLSALFFFLALISKEVALIVPVLCAVLLLVRSWLPASPDAALPAASAGSARRRRSKQKPEHKKSFALPITFSLYLLCIIVFLLLRGAADREAIYENTFVTLAEQLMNALRCFALYIWHALAGGGYEYIILGWRLPDPRFNFALPGDVAAWTAIGVAIVLACAACLFTIRIKRPAAVLGLAGFFASLVPVAGFVPLYSFFSVRFLYLPSFFLALAAVDCGLWLQRKMNRPIFMRAGAAAACAVALWWGAETFRQDGNWRDDITLMLSMKERASVSPMYYFCLGNGYRYRGDFKQAIENFTIAVQQYEKFFDAHMNLGACCLVLGETEPSYYARAVEAYASAAKIFPGDSRVFTMLAEAYMLSGDESGAVRSFLTAYALDKSPEIRQRLLQLNIDPDK